MSTYRNVLAWQKGMDLVDAVYAAVRRFPNYEQFELGKQMRSAASSIPSLIAEGRGRHTTRDYVHFLYEARGSANELETQLEIAVRQNYLPTDAGRRLIEQSYEVNRLINTLINNATST